MAGLQASGKSTVARCLRPTLDAVLLDKDELRAALFPPDHVDYSDAQNDLVVDTAYRVAGYLIGKDPDRPIILDGRTYSRKYQIAQLWAAAERIGAPLRIVECVCSEASARRRLEADRDHPAADRDVELYLRVRAAAEPIPEPKLVIDTDALTPEEAVREILDDLREGSWPW